jgi:hypothetical protein
VAHRREHETGERRWSSRLLTWDTLMRLIGAGGVVWLLLDSGVEKPGYMIACVGLATLGVPSALSLDRKRRRDNE